MKKTFQVTKQQFDQIPSNPYADAEETKYPKDNKEFFKEVDELRKEVDDLLGPKKKVV